MIRTTIGMAAVALVLAGCGGGGDPAARSAAKMGGGPQPAGFIGLDGPLLKGTPEINHALETAMVGQPVSWTDQESGAVTQLTVIRTFLTNDEKSTYCREYNQSLTNGSKSNTTHGVACRESDGSWTAVPG